MRGPWLPNRSPRPPDHGLPRLGQETEPNVCGAVTWDTTTNTGASFLQDNMPPRPHILLITTDEHALESIGCYGATAVQTPNIDRLAAEGVRFTRAYTVSPLCMPARTALATGLYPHHCSCICNGLQSHMRQDLPNLYRRLKSVGYTTAHVGKCHFVPVRYGEIRPGETQPYERERDYYVRLGIDHLALQDDKQVSVWFMDDYARELAEAGLLKAYRDAVWDREYAKVFTFPGPAEWHPDTWVGRKATELIDGYESDSPLFVWLSFSGPHYTFDPPEEYLDRVDAGRLTVGRRREGDLDDPSKIHYDSYHGSPDGSIDGRGPAPGGACKNYSDEYWRRLRHYYFANVAQIDHEIGRVVAAAQRRFGDDLIVVFTADHGEMLGNHRLWGKQCCAYEEVMRIPFIGRMPGVFDVAESDAFVSQLDLMPTLLNLAGAQLPPRLDGRDLRTALADAGPQCAFTESRHFAAVTDGSHKYIHLSRPNITRHEFYDLTDDPHEFLNRVDDPTEAEHVSRLRGVLLDFLTPDHPAGTRSFSDA